MSKRLLTDPKMVTLSHIQIIERDVRNMADAIERVRDLHKLYTHFDGEPVCSTCRSVYGYLIEWPCPTLTALEDQV